MTISKKKKEKKRIEKEDKDRLTKNKVNLPEVGSLYSNSVLKRINASTIRKPHE